MGSDGSERFSIPCGWPWKDRRQMVLALFSPLTLFSPLAQQEGDPRTPGGIYTRYDLASSLFRPESEFIQERMQSLFYLSTEAVRCVLPDLGTTQE